MNAPGHTSAEPPTPPASSTGNAPVSPADSDPGVPTNKVARPPWLVLLCGFLLLDGGFKFAGWVPSSGTLEGLKWNLPPFCFVRWYAYGDPWGWSSGIEDVLLWLTPLLEIIAGRSIWRAPAKARRCVLIIAGCWALEGLLEAGVPSEHVSRGYVWSWSEAASGLSLVGLAGFAVWFIQRWKNLERPAATLISGYLILTGLRGLLPALYDVVRWGLLVLRYGPSYWNFVTARNLLDVLAFLLVVVAGLYMLRRDPPRLQIALAAFLAPARALATLAWGCIDLVGSDYWSIAYLAPALYNTAPVAIALALARFLWRNPDLFRDPTPRCKTCNYNLTMNTSGVCPECGTEVRAGSTA